MVKAVESPHGAAAPGAPDDDRAVKEGVRGGTRGFPALFLVER
jgi:hypothetical protein